MCIRDRPKVIIPVFPGTNCEYDTAKAFARAGADPEILVIRNLTPADVAESCKALVKAIDNSRIVMLPGGHFHDRGALLLAGAVRHHRPHCPWPVSYTHLLWRFFERPHLGLPLALPLGELSSECETERVGSKNTKGEPTQWSIVFMWKKSPALMWKPPA